MLHITRTDGRPLTGWTVRFYQGRKVISRQSFPDSQHGGKEPALVAAKSWMDEQVKLLAITHGISSLNQATHSGDTRNTSGIVGVSLCFNANRPRWEAKVGRGVRECFYTKKYGYVGAFKRAYRYRCKKAGLVYDKTKMPPEPPAWYVDGI